MTRGRGRAEPDRPLVALVADRHGRGTNVLLLSPPDAIPFPFGPGQPGRPPRGGRRGRRALRRARRAAGRSTSTCPTTCILADELGLLDPARVG